MGTGGAFLGLSSDSWSVVFDAVQTLAIVIALVFGLYELRELRRQRQSDSLERMFAEWRPTLSLQGAVLETMPMPEGDLGMRAEKLASQLCLMSQSSSASEREQCRAVLTTARDMVHALNDLGALVERGSVGQREFFGQFHIRILELVALLEPFVVLISACRGTRWGLRLRRMRIGAERYHHTSRVHRSLEVKIRGRVVLEGKEQGRIPATIRELRLHRRLLPTKAECMSEEDRLMSAVRRRLDAALAEDGTTSEQFLEALPIQI